MYNYVKAKVGREAKLSVNVNCTQGVKQDDVGSPIFFSLFIAELALEIINNGRRGVTLSPDLIELFILLFADGIVLLSLTVIGLQIQLNSLYRALAQLQHT